jgi:V-type H+-transporting ATPase subunit d
MIDNVILLLTGTLHERDTRELLDKCHPLGKFQSLATLAITTNPKDAYKLVLVDTPLAPYAQKNFGDSQDFTELNIEVRSPALLGLMIHSTSN